MRVSHRYLSETTGVFVWIFILYNWTYFCIHVIENIKIYDTYITLTIYIYICSCISLHMSAPPKNTRGSSDFRAELFCFRKACNSCGTSFGSQSDLNSLWPTLSHQKLVAPKLAKGSSWHRPSTRFQNAFYITLYPILLSNLAFCFGGHMISKSTEVKSNTRCRGAWKQSWAMNGKTHLRWTPLVSSCILAKGNLAQAKHPFWKCLLYHSASSYLTLLSALVAIWSARQQKSNQTQDAEALENSHGPWIVKPICAGHHLCHLASLQKATWHRPSTRFENAFYTILYPPI